MFFIRKKPAHSRDEIADYKDELGNDEVIYYDKKKQPDHPLARIWQAFSMLYLKTKISRP